MIMPLRQLIVFIAAAVVAAFTPAIQASAQEEPSPSAVLKLTANCNPPDIVTEPYQGTDINPKPYQVPAKKIERRRNYFSGDDLHWVIGEERIWNVIDTQSNSLLETFGYDYTSGAFYKNLDPNIIVSGFNLQVSCKNCECFQVTKHYTGKLAIEKDENDPASTRQYVFCNDKRQLALRVRSLLSLNRRRLAMMKEVRRTPLNPRHSRQLVAAQDLVKTQGGHREAWRRLPTE